MYINIGSRFGPQHNEKENKIARYKRMTAWEVQENAGTCDLEQGLEWDFTEILQNLLVQEPTLNIGTFVRYVPACPGHVFRNLDDDMSDRLKMLHAMKDVNWRIPVKVVMQEVFTDHFGIVCIRFITDFQEHPIFDICPNITSYIPPENDNRHEIARTDKQMDFSAMGRIFLTPYLLVA